MGILLHNDVDWSPANWVGRGLFNDLLDQTGLPPSLVEEIRFCLDAELDTLDMRQASIDDLRSLRGVLDSVVQHNVKRGPTSFQLPEFFPVYLEKLRDLSSQLDVLLAEAR